MNEFMISSFIKITFLSVCIFLSPLAQATYLPDLELTGDDGKKHHINDYIGRGRWTTVMVWGPKCPACIAEMPEIQSLYEDKDETGIDVLGLVIDYPSFNYARLKQVQQFKEDYSITFPGLLISSKIYDSFSIGWLKGTPTMILINPEGKVAAVRTGGLSRNFIENFIARKTKAAAVANQKQKKK
ncbi:hypothetical protein MNBD_GAMMA11-29 [hydrothermal vent metagenome]|uniref:Thioredoxin domain-containing protein n=1 Tax=hydrothermal vent metagenome TaxID=652676 RepID=A0A3B0X8Y6_9ZZZZ